MKKVLVFIVVFAVMSLGIIMPALAETEHATASDEQTTGDLVYEMIEIETEPIVTLEQASIGVKEALRSEPINAPGFVRSTIDWFGEALARLIGSGNAYIEFESVKQQRLGVEITWYEMTEIPLAFVAGYTFLTEEPSEEGYWTAGVKVTDMSWLPAPVNEWASLVEPGLSVRGSPTGQAQFVGTLRWEWK